MRSIVLVLLLLAGPALSAGFELNGRALGDRSDEVLTDPRYDCGGVSACFLFTSCVLRDAAREALYGAPLEALTLYYAGERVGAIEAQFAPEDFDRVVQASMREHGEAQPEQPAHAVSGNAVYTWRAGSRVLRVERFFAPTGRASLIITDRSFLTELVDR
jgi:hypothetical protein